MNAVAKINQKALEELENKLNSLYEQLNADTDMVDTDRIDSEVTTIADVLYIFGYQMDVVDDHVVIVPLD